MPKKLFILLLVVFFCMNLADTYFITNIYVDKFYRNDKDVVLAVLKNDPFRNKFSFIADESMKKDKPFVMAAMQISTNVLEYIDTSLKNDIDVVLAAVKSDGKQLKYASQPLKNNTKVVLAAIKQSPKAFMHASDLLKKDKKIVLAAISNDALMLRQVDKSFRKDKEVVLVALQSAKFGEAGSIYKDIDVSLKKDTDLALATIKRGSGMLGMIFDKSISKDKEFALAALKISPYSFNHIDRSFRKDKTMMTEIFKYYNNKYDDEKVMLFLKTMVIDVVDESFRADLKKELGW